MKVPPKRKGNFYPSGFDRAARTALNESPSEKEGKLKFGGVNELRELTLNESPSEKEGKYDRAKRMK